MKKDKELISFIEDLEETELRLHTYLRRLEEDYDQFKKRPLLKKRKEYDKAKKNYIYYKGKFYAYYSVLESLGSDVPKVLTRLRGIISPRHNELMETKMHYSEVSGHFPTDEYLEFKKVKK